MNMMKATARATKVEQTRGAAAKGYTVTFEFMGDGVPPQPIRIDVLGRGGMDLGEVEKAARKLLDKFCHEIAPAKPALQTIRPRMTLPAKENDDSE